MTTTTHSQEMPAYTPPHPLTMFGAVIAYAVRGLTGAYGLSVTGFLIFRLLIGEEQWVVTGIFNSFLHLLILPALLLFPLALLMRRRELVALTVMPFGALMLWYAPVFLNTPPNVGDDVPRLTVATHNIATYRNDAAQVVAVIREMDADIVLLQELGHSISAVLDTELAEAYPYRALVPQRNSIRGQGMLSRYPIVDDAEWFDFGYAPQRVVLDVNGTQVAVYNTHMTFPFGENRLTQRRTDTQRLVELATAEPMPVIVAGDFNLTEHHGDYDRLTTHFTDAYRQAARAFGWTYSPFEGIALGRIDYIFHSDVFTATSARVWSHAGGSDHFPVWAELALTGS